MSLEHFRGKKTFKSIKYLLGFTQIGDVILSKWNTGNSHYVLSGEFPPLTELNAKD